MSTQISQVSYPSTYWSYMIILYSSRFFLFHPGGVSPCLLHQLPEFAVLWQEGLSAKNGGVGCGIRNCRSEGTIDRYYDVDIWLYLILFPTEMNRVFHSIAFNASTDELLSLEKKPDPIFRESLCSLPGPVFPPGSTHLAFLHQGLSEASHSAFWLCEPTDMFFLESLKLRATQVYS